MRRNSGRPRSTSYISTSSGSLLTARESFSSRRISLFAGDGTNRKNKEDDFIDHGQLQGRIKVLNSIKNSDRCMSITFRPHDGRFYAVGLANGIINVYSSKTDNILYTLNNDDKDLPFSDVSTTCVRFRPCPGHSQTEERALQTNGKVKGGQRKLSRTALSVDSEYLFPPISSRSSCSPQRRKSYSALGHNLDLINVATSDNFVVPSNLVTATFTNGDVKTFNFMTEQCVQEIHENREILSMSYNRSGSMLVTGGDNGCLLVYDAETGALKSSFEPPFDYDQKLLRTYSIQFHPHSETNFLSGGWNREIHFHDERVANMLVCSIPGPKICGESLSFHSSGKEFCAAAWGNNEGIPIYDYAMKRPFENAFGFAYGKEDSTLDVKAMKSKKEQRFSKAYFYSARYIMDNFIVVSGAFPGSVTIVERDSNRKAVASISDLPRNVTSLDTHKSRLAFILGDEVCCTETFI